MPDELPPIPGPNTFHPQGTISAKKKKWIFIGLVGAAALLMAFSTLHTSTVPTRKDQIVGPMPEPPKPRQRIVPEQQPMQYHPLGESFQQAQYAQPQQTERERIRDERIQYEQKAAFEDSLVPRPANVPVNPTTKGGSEESKPESQGTVSVQGKGSDGPKPIDPDQPLYTLPEGTVIDCALVNELNGEDAGPVQVQVSTDVYAPGTRTLLIPQGARILGETSKVSGFGQQRLAVTFHRILIGTGPSQYSISLDKDTPGLDQEGATALHDKVNGHYLSIFGASLAIGAVGGLAQIGNGYSGFGYSPSTEFRNGVSQSMAQSSDQVLSRFLNRMPTITIRPGTRVTIYLTADKQFRAV